MDNEGSLPHSQMSDNGPYPKPDQSSPCPSIPLPVDLSQYYPPNYAWVFQTVSFPQGSPPKPCIHFFSPQYMLHASPILFFSILSPEQYWVRNADHKLLIM